MADTENPGLKGRLVQEDIATVCPQVRWKPTSGVVFKEAMAALLLWTSQGMHVTIAFIQWLAGKCVNLSRVVHRILWYNWTHYYIQFVSVLQHSPIVRSWYQNKLFWYYIMIGALCFTCDWRNSKQSLEIDWQYFVCFFIHANICRWCGCLSFNLLTLSLLSSKSVFSQPFKKRLYEWCSENL